MHEMTKRLSLAYWPNPGANESANRERGNAEVDKLTISELTKFFAEIQCGPTYCMVTQRVQQLLEAFPPHIEDRRARALNAIAAAKSALLDLNNVIDS